MGTLNLDIHDHISEDIINNVISTTKAQSMQMQKNKEEFQTGDKKLLQQIDDLSNENLSPKDSNHSSSSSLTS